MWDDLPESNDPDLAPLRLLDAGDHAAIVVAYSMRAKQIASDNPPTVPLSMRLLPNSAAARGTRPTGT
jgi:hypothetical protein